jgi:hypothetical protein
MVQNLIRSGRGQMPLEIAAPFSGETYRAADAKFHVVHSGIQIYRVGAKALLDRFEQQRGLQFAFRMDADGLAESIEHAADVFEGQR